MHWEMNFPVFVFLVGCVFGNVQAFLDFEPEFVHNSFKNSGIMTTTQPWIESEDDYSFCQRMYPDYALVRDARSRMGQISWDVSTPFGSMDGHIIYCDVETHDGYGRRNGHFAIGPDQYVYELHQNEEGSFFPIYDDYY